MILVLNLIFTTIIRSDIKKIKKDIENGLIKEDGREKSVLRRYIKRMTKENPYSDNIPFKMEIVRKSFHLSGFVLLIAYTGFLALPPLTALVNDALIVSLQQVELSYNFIWGSLSDYPFGLGDFQAVGDQAGS